MNENSLRAVLDDAVAGEPPIGLVARSALRIGMRIRRRRRAGAFGGVALVAALAVAVPAVHGGFGFLSATAPSAQARPAGMGGHGDRPQELQFSPNGKILATADTDGTARLWNVATEAEIGAPIRIIGGHIYDVAFSPDGQVLATADSGGTVRLWSVATHRPIGAPFEVSHDRVEAVAFSPNGKLLATAGIGGSARLWDVATRRQVGAAMIPADGITGVTFSPDGKLLATTSGRGAVELWSVARHRPVGKTFGNAINVVTFSPNGKRLASAGFGIQVWGTLTQYQLGSTMSAGHFDAYGVAFTPNGKTLVTTDSDGTIKQFSVATHKQIGPSIIPAGRNGFGVEALSPNGKILATTQFAGPARLWNLSTGTEQP
jgi:WD40 repeat protein